MRELTKTLAPDSPMYQVALPKYSKLTDERKHLGSRAWPGLLEAKYQRQHNAEQGKDVR